MAYINLQLILERCREVLTEGVVLALRSVAAGSFENGLFDQLTDGDKSVRAMDVPIIEPRVASLKKSDASPPSMHSLWLYDLEVEIAVVRYLGEKQRLTSDARDVVMAIAMRDGDVIAQAFSSPGALSTTVEAGSTNIVSGVMWHLGSAAGRVAMEAGKPGLIETVNRFGCVVQVTAQT